jgi:hypothetical protein
MNTRLSASLLKGSARLQMRQPYISSGKFEARLQQVFHNVATCLSNSAILKACCLCSASKSSAMMFSIP